MRLLSYFYKYNFISSFDGVLQDGSKILLRLLR